MVIVEVSIVPLGTNTPSISYFVAECHKILKDQNKVKYELTSMGTILEGEFNDCFELIKKMHECPFDAGAKRVNTHIKIDDRRDITTSMDQKVQRVKDKL